MKVSTRVKTTKVCVCVRMIKPTDNFAVPYKETRKTEAEREGMLQMPSKPNTLPNQRVEGVVCECVVASHKTGKTLLITKRIATKVCV